MSISVAVTELKKELAALDKTIEDAEKKKAPILAALQSLQQGDAKTVTGALARKGKPGPKPGAKKKPGPKPGAKKATAKKATAKKAAVVPETTAPKKRVMSAEAKARIGAAAKKRWAAKKAAEKKA